MNGKPWTRREDATLRRMLRRPNCSREEIAEALGRTEMSIKSRIRKLGLGKPRKWGVEELDLVRELYGKVPAGEIAQRLDRPVTQVYAAADRLRLNRTKPKYAGLTAFIRKHHRLGWSDAEIATAWSAIEGKEPIDRRSLRDRRASLGLPHNALSKHRRRRVAAKTREQLQRKGLSSLAQERVEAYRRYARRRGWPEDLRPRAVQILDVLYEQGPKTRRELAAAIGMPWKGSRKSLVSNDPEGTYLAHLENRGLVVRLGRVARTGPKKGQHCFVYAIPSHVIRRPDYEHYAQEPHDQPERHRRGAAGRRTDVPGVAAAGRV